MPSSNNYLLFRGYEVMSNSLGNLLDIIYGITSHACALGVRFARVGKNYDVNMRSFHVRGTVVTSRSRGVCGMKVNSRLFYHVLFLLTVHQDETTCQPRLQSREGTVYVHVSIQRLLVGHLPIDYPPPYRQRVGI